ncbi:MAG: cyclic nucleotide-gated ion channel [Hyphomicrobiaceae bacterium]
MVNLPSRDKVDDLRNKVAERWVETTERRSALRRRVYEILEVGRGEDQVSIWVDRFLITLIILNVLAFAFETVPSFQAAYGSWFYAFDIISVLIFTVEYALRLWSCIEVPFLKRMPTTEARMRFAMRPYLIIDLLAILPFYLQFIIPLDLRVLRVLRLFRFFKLARYSPAMHTLVRVLINERRSLSGALLLMMAVLIFASTGIYFIERHAQPDAFGTIPDAAWWTMATLTTVGYGDVSPTTAFGKMFGSVVMVIGLGMFALPIAIISTGFAQELGRRDFVVTWSLMSRIPLLAELDANAVAELMPHLHAHNYPPHWEVIHAGTQATSMFFIASGSVRVNTSGGETTLGTGDFFGEIAMIEEGKYDYSFTTTSKVRLLKLNYEDFLRLQSAYPIVTDRIKAMANARKQARLEGRKEPRGYDEIDVEERAETAETTAGDL